MKLRFSGLRGSPSGSYCDAIEPRWWPGEVREVSAELARRLLSDACPGVFAEVEANLVPRGAELPPDYDAGPSDLVAELDGLHWATAKRRIEAGDFDDCLEEAIDATERLSDSVRKAAAERLELLTADNGPAAGESGEE